MQSLARTESARRVVVAGADGYLGRNVVRAFADRGAEIVAVSRRRLPRRPAPGTTCVSADVLTSVFDIAALPGGAPEVLVHLAWQDGFTPYAPAHIDFLPAHPRLVRNADAAGVTRVSSIGSQAQRFVDENTLPVGFRLPAFPDRPYDSPGVWGDATRIDEILAGEARRR